MKLFDVRLKKQNKKKTEDYDFSEFYDALMDEITYYKNIHDTLNRNGNHYKGAFDIHPSIIRLSTFSLS